MSIVTLADAKAHMNVVGEQDDAVIATKLAASEAWVGAFVGKPLADFDPVPETLKEAVRMLAAHLYENREASIVGVTMSDVSPGIYDLMAPHREYVF